MTDQEMWDDFFKQVPHYRIVYETPNMGAMSFKQLEEWENKHGSLCTVLTLASNEITSSGLRQDQLDNMIKSHMDGELFFIAKLRFLGTTQ